MDRSIGCLSAAPFGMQVQDGVGTRSRPNSVRRPSKRHIKEAHAKSIYDYMTHLNLNFRPAPTLRPRDDATFECQRRR